MRFPSIDDLDDFANYAVIVGISLHVESGFAVWRIPLGFQLVPAGIMAFGLLTVPESPRWLASNGRNEEAIQNLAYLRRLPIDDDFVRHEMAEIEAAITEEREARKGLGLKEAFFGKGNSIRFVIAIVIFLLQQWSGQNSVNYYAPQIFQSVGSILYPSSFPLNCSLVFHAVDWLHWHIGLPPRFGYIRRCQSCSDCHLCLLPSGKSWT